MPSSTSCHLFLPLSVIVFLLHISLSNGIGIESIRINENTPTYCNISWVIEGGSSWDYYTVDVVTNSGNSLNGYPTNTTEMHHQINGLRPNTTYTVVVTPWTSEGKGDSLNTSLITESIKEGQILVSDITSTSAFLQWRDYGSLFYSVLYKSSDVMNSVGGIFNPEVELSLSRPGTVFNITVRDQHNMDVASTRIRTAPEGPENISLEQISTNEATLSWTPPDTPHDAYEFYVINNSTNERSLVTSEQRDNISDYEVMLSGLLPATIYSFEVGTILNARDSFEMQQSDQSENPVVFGRTGPEAPLKITLTDISDDSVTVTLTPPASRHDAFELYLSNATTDQKSLIITIQQYTWTETGLSPSTNYTIEIVTVLNEEGSLPLQRSENNPMMEFQTGDAASINLHYILLLISLLALFLA